MKISLQYLIILPLILMPKGAIGSKLEFDAKKNNARLFGPYVKYNIRRLPYSFGRYKFDKKDISLEIRSISLPKNDKANNDDLSEEKDKLYVIWPRFLLNFGSVTISTKSGKVLVEEEFESSDTLGGDKYVHYKIEDQSIKLIKKLKKPFRVCLHQEFQESKVKACSDYLRRKRRKFINISSQSDNKKSVAYLNGKKVPKNAQINIPKKQKKVNLNLKFKSGFQIRVIDKVRIIGIENVAIDPMARQIGIIGGDGAVSTRTLTFKDRFIKFIKEKNYYKSLFEITQEWPQNLEDAEMEFVPYELGASAQHYGLALERLPPPFKFKLADNSPIATYLSTVELPGTKNTNEKLTAKTKNELFIHKNEKSFVWKFPSPEKGRMSQNYIAFEDKGDNFYFSRRIFRAHRGSLSASAALSSDPYLNFVLGYVYSADFWPESIWGKQSWAHQRWGFAFNFYETLQIFKPRNFSENVILNPANIDIMYRFSKGVRPVQSSFGLTMRYMNYLLYRSISEDLSPGLMGIGGFWHTAPQKIVDDVFNIVPYFRYPKWMELSAYYYPLIIGEFDLGFSWSLHAKGRLYFSQDWFFDASINVMDITFEKENDVKPRITTVHGTLGFGWMF